MVGAVGTSDVGAGLGRDIRCHKVRDGRLRLAPGAHNRQREKAAAKPNSHKTASMHLPGDAVRPILPVTAPSVESLKN